MATPLIIPTPLSAPDEAALPAAVGALMRHPAVILYRTEREPNTIRVLARGRVEESAAGLAILPLARDPGLHLCLAETAVASMERAAALLAEAA